MSNKNSGIFDVVCFVVLAGVLLSAWGYWVHQRDIFLDSVMSCMMDMSEQEYNRCVEVVRG